MASRTIEVHVKVMDLEPVKAILAATEKLARAVDAHLAMPTVRNYPKHAESLARALDEFRAEVLEQRTDEVVVPPVADDLPRCDCCS